MKCQATSECFVHLYAVKSSAVMKKISLGQFPSIAIECGDVIVQKLAV